MLIYFCHESQWEEKANQEWMHENLKLHNWRLVFNCELSNHRWSTCNISFNMYVCKILQTQDQVLNWFSYRLKHSLNNYMCCVCHSYIRRVRQCLYFEWINGDEVQELWTLITWRSNTTGGGSADETTTFMPAEACLEVTQTIGVAFKSSECLMKRVDLLTILYN